MEGGLRTVTASGCRFDLDHIAFEKRVDDIDAVQHLGEDRVLMIESRVVDQIDEELSVAGIRR